MKLKIGDSVIVLTASAHNGSNEQPAIVNRIWSEDRETSNGPVTVNATVLPDCGSPYASTSLQVFDTKPDEPRVGQGWIPA